MAISFLLIPAHTDIQKKKKIENSKPKNKTKAENNNKIPLKLRFWFSLLTHTH